jgi:hypothetical protein
MATQQLAEVLFNNSDLIPEGLYLQLMNLSKDIFKEKKEEKIIKHTIMVYQDADHYKKFHEYHVNPFEFNHVTYEYVFEVQSPFLNRKTYYEIIKKNKVSFICNLWEFKINTMDDIQDQYEDDYEGENEYFVTSSTTFNIKLKWDNLKDLMIPQKAFSNERKQGFTFLKNNSSISGIEIDIKDAKKYFPVYNF